MRTELYDSDAVSSSGEFWISVFVEIQVPQALRHAISVICSALSAFERIGRNHNSQAVTRR